MKINIFIKTILTLLLSGSFNSCILEQDKEKYKTLPPETQTGKNTFGCYVNGELFVASPGSVGWGYTHLQAAYYKTHDLLTISASAKNGFIKLDILNPKENIKQNLHGISFRDINYLFCEERNIEEVYLTKFDTINFIVSGTFKSKFQSINITQGRFDVSGLQIVDWSVE